MTALVTPHTAFYVKAENDDSDYWKQTIRG